MSLKKYFNQVFCINLNRRKDRWSETVTELRKWDLLNDVNRYLGVDGNKLTYDNKKFRVNPGELGLLKTHIKLLQLAKTKKYKNILILEDDIEFTEEIKNLDDYMSLVPSDWDILYFGGNHNVHEGEKLNKINDKIIKCSRTYTTHCIVFRNTVYDKCLDLIKDCNKPVDVYYSSLQKELNVYSFYPNIALQRVSYSDIQNKIEDNRRVLEV
jgi:GR25 family glycosyltransferase involved in LPS biosynthesis